MKTLYLECNMGAAGDMLMGALSELIDDADGFVARMNSLGLPILGDDFYPDVIQRPYDDFSRPLELVARRLEFDDPVTGESRAFVSNALLGDA